MISAFLDAVNMASIAIILSVIVEMGRSTLLDWRTIIIAVVSFIVSFYFKKFSAAFIILGGAMLVYELALI
jgi:chromate transporter